MAATTVKAAAVSATTNASPAVAPPVAANLPSPYCSSYFGDNVAALSTRPTPYPASGAVAGLRLHPAKYARSLRAPT